MQRGQGGGCSGGGGGQGHLGGALLSDPLGSLLDLPHSLGKVQVAHQLQPGHICISRGCGAEATYVQLRTFLMNQLICELVCCMSKQQLQYFARSSLQATVPVHGKDHLAASSVGVSYVYSCY